MKIVICGSMSASKEMVRIEKELLKLNHIVILPKNTHDYANEVLSPETHEESAKHKIQEDLIKAYFAKIKESKAVLIVNTHKGEKLHYIGGNTLIEMAFAHVLNKRLYVLNELLDSPTYHDEIIALRPIIINGDLTKII